MTLVDKELKNDFKDMRTLQTDWTQNTYNFSAQSVTGFD